MLGLLSGNRPIRVRRRRRRMQCCGGICCWSVGLSSVRPGVNDLCALIATLLSIENRRGVSAVPCISPSRVGSPPVWWYVWSVIPRPVLTRRFMLSLTRVLDMRIFLDTPAFCANMFEFWRYIRSKQFFSSYCVIAIVLMPMRAVSMVRSLSIAASMDCLWRLDPCCSSVGFVCSKFFWPRWPIK